MNIKSMTGYGKGVCEIKDKKIIVEIRTLNSKQLDLNVKLPAIYRESEIALRATIAKGVIRGKADIFITTETNEENRYPKINSEAAEVYYKQLSALNIDLSGTDYLQTIMRMPEVMKQETVEVTAEERDAIFSATEQAIISLNSFREQEGCVMISDILQRIDNIEQLKNELLQYEGERVETVKKRLREALDKLSVTTDENRFEQELIFYIEKFDITEEKVRLQNHLNYFREVCAFESEVGRKIGFISQEIGREINTTGSKANHSQMQQLVVKMKDELEKIKEQSLNIL